MLHISSISEQTRDRGYWKFNNSLTEDKDFVEKLRTYINDIKSTFNEHQDSRINWEFLKYKIQRFSNRYNLEQEKKRKARQKVLESRLQELEQRIVDTEAEIENIIDDYENTKAELEQIHNHIANGIILRLKVRWYEEGEKKNKYFLSLEKRNKTKSHIRKLINISGEEITDQKLILLEIKSFYTNLYTSKSRKTERDCLQYIASTNTPKLSDTDKLSCEGKLTLQNC